LAKKSKSTLNKKNKKNPKLVFFLVAGIFILAMLLLFLLEKAPTDQQAIDFDLTGQPSIGEEDAPVKIVEFGDFKCIYCKYFEEDVFPQIQKDYIDSGKVEFHFVNKAFIGPDSLYAAFVGEAVYDQNPEAFWDYYHLVYENQGPEDQQWATMEYLLSLVEKEIPDVDITKVVEYISTHDMNTVIESDNKLSQEGNVRSTPTIFINGVVVEDSFDYKNIQEMINKALEDANE
jgi:protein-disulfide isomerase